MAVKKKALKKTAVKKKVKSVKKPVKAANKSAKKVTAKKAKAVPTKKAIKAPKATPKKAVKKQAAPAKVEKAVSSPPPSKVSWQSFMTPLDDRLLVRLTGTEKKTAGGLYIPETVSDVSGNLQGMVVCIGRGHRDKKGRVRPMDVRVGDQVVFSEYSGSKIKIQNEDLIILREADVMGVVSK